MEKKQYLSPLTEVTTFGAMSSILITSIGMGGSSMPEEPGKTSAPMRRTPVF